MQQNGPSKSVTLLLLLLATIYDNSSYFMSRSAVSFVKSGVATPKLAPIAETNCYFHYEFIRR